MKRFVEGADRAQGTLFPERLEDWIGEDNPVRVVDVFVDELDLGGWALAGSSHGRPAGRAITLLFC
jgi:transposase